jgi:hypothetical protein
MNTDGAKSQSKRRSVHRIRLVRSIAFSHCYLALQQNAAKRTRPFISHRIVKAYQDKVKVNHNNNNTALGGTHWRIDRSATYHYHFSNELGSRPFLYLSRVSYSDE